MFTMKPFNLKSFSLLMLAVGTALQFLLGQAHSITLNPTSQTDNNGVDEAGKRGGKSNDQANQKLWTPEVALHLLDLVENIHTSMATSEVRFDHLRDNLENKLENMQSQLAAVEQRLENQVVTVEARILIGVKDKMNDLGDKLKLSLAALVKENVLEVMLRNYRCGDGKESRQSDDSREVSQCGEALVDRTVARLDEVVNKTIREALTSMTPDMDKRVQAIDSRLRNISLVVGGIDSDKCYEKMDSLDRKVHVLDVNIDDKMKRVARKVDKIDTNVDDKIQALVYKFSDVGANVEDIHREITNESFAAAVDSVIDKFNSIDVKVDAILSRNENEIVSAEIKRLEKKVDDKVEAFQAFIAWYNAWETRFDFSVIFKDRIYLATKAEAPFQIDEAANACQAVGGYLIELDSDEEFHFVRDFVMRLGGISFFTGTNDIAREGTFVSKHSGKPLEINQWAGGQPDNFGGKEDCMEIRTAFNGYLNDWICNGPPGKYVCEVPYLFTP